MSEPGSRPTLEAKLFCEWATPLAYILQPEVVVRFSQYVVYQWSRVLGFE
jgi:hypothetical protein